MSQTQQASTTESRCEASVGKKEEHMPISL